MRLYRILGSIVLLLLALLLIEGCSGGDERRHPLFQKGQKARQAGDGAEAAADFRLLLERRPDAVLTHLELAGVYDELLDDPLLAAVHYRIFLERRPDAPDADAIRVWQRNAERRFCQAFMAQDSGASPVAETPLPSSGAGLLPGKPVTAPAAISPAVPAAASTDDAKLAALQEENARLRDYLADCKKQLAYLSGELRRLQGVRDAIPARSEAPETGAAPTGGAVTQYTVVSGDTPAAIARKVYGDSRRYPAIMAANPGVSERSLRPGMVLKIPPRP